MELQEYQKELLKKGNCYTFAEIFCEKFKRAAKKNNFNPNNYNAWCDFNDGLFTVWNKNGDKDFFDVEMNYCGTKEY